MKDQPNANDAVKDGMMKKSGMMMHKKVEDRLDMIERVLQQVIEREAVEATAN